MARYPLRGVARDGSGRVISGATVQIYVADTTTAPTAIYAAKTGGTAITTGQVTSGTDGRWMAYIDADTYPVPSLFDIVTSASGGYVTGYDYDVWN